MTKYAIGIDYGTESGRAVLVSLADGSEIADHVTPYPHSVMDQTLPDGTPLGHEWALQHPQDYLDVIHRSVPEVMKTSGVNPEDVAGLGIDFTACTMLPVDETDTPLCFYDEWKENPHSWIKLWKHHAAQKHANEINALAEKQGEAFLARYGGKLSSEWMLAKAYQIAEEAPEVYDASDRFVEATDWVISQLSGTFKRNSCTAGYKAAWHKETGFPDESFFKELHPRLENLVSDKLKGEIAPLGTKAGGLTSSMADKTGLPEGLPVAVGNVDAHASVPAAGVVDEGKMVMAMGTSICHMLLGTEEVTVEGMCGVVEDGIIPGYYGYEAGQSAVGDIFAWYVNEAVPHYIYKEAESKGTNVHQLLMEKADTLSPGESGVIALDWWNGNRSVLVDTQLSGMFLGMTLQTKPEEMYRALLEATAFGTRQIVDSFHENGVPVHELYACGGLPQKNPLLMQIYADVTNRTIYVADSVQTPAVGAAMFGAVAAGSARGGFDSITDASAVMGRVQEKAYQPDPENVRKYDTLFQEYKELHDYFGRGGNDVMKRLLRGRTAEEMTQAAGSGNDDR
ncbi:ribulokinase [Alkalicoccus urumqiensis]|uniref:Ribulokinase n=1 Tax=Alkalicoccus urumqiensis TaxID=1548213 RepID=A0A2P6MLU0_ALKUR|nr:ribulokinase [Alkalicoccus urumqiensis]PRO67264.1 ribulokinase [Alkalicoccus urumqiensis]